MNFLIGSSGEIDFVVGNSLTIFPMHSMILRKVKEGRRDLETQTKLDRTDPPDPPAVATGTMPPKPKSKNVDKKRLDGFWIVFGLMLLMILLTLGYFID